jgi:putative DNA primase/helicase
MNDDDGPGGALFSMSSEAIFIRRQQYFKNDFLPYHVYSPGASDRDGQPIKNAGKRPKGNWRLNAREDPPRAVRFPPDSDAKNTALLLGAAGRPLVAVDVDVRDPALVDEIVALIEKRLGTSPLVRQGQPPKVAVLYRGATVFSKRATAKLQFADRENEKPTQVELLADGQGLVIDGIHPGTGEPYRWLDQHPFYVKRDELPEITEEQADALTGEIEAILRAHGAVDWVDPAAPPPREPSPRRDSHGHNFFDQVNDAALERAEDWVPSLFPTVRQPAPNGAWRIPAPLRGLPASKQDLSIDPRHGIRDFHTGQGLTVIDLVLEYGGGIASNPRDAALWLCQRIGVAPERFGYRDRPEEPPPPEPPDWDPPPPEQPPEGPPPQPTITVRGGLRHLAVSQGLTAMRDARVPLFVRGQQLVRVVASSVKSSDGDDIEMPAIVQAPIPMLDRLAGQSARWLKINRHGFLIRIDPPQPVLEQMAAMSGEWPFPPIQGLLTTPSMRRDGTLLTVPGYDWETGLYLAQPASLKLPPIPERPTRHQAETALADLLGLLGEFAFADEASRSVTLSLLITPIVRAAMPVVPIHLISAPSAGTGKSFLASLATVLLAGEHLSAIAQAPDDAETEKRLIGAALLGRTLIVLDNARHVIAGDFMCQIGERPVLQLRPLGTSNVVVLHNNFCVVITGNNAGVADDLVRRTIRIALDANTPEPEKRQFRLDPIAMVRADRGRYIAAALTICRAYLAAGSPGCLPRLASYGPWSDRVRSPLVWLGMADPVDTMAELAAGDPVREARTMVFAAWAGALTLDFGDGGLKVPELVTLAENTPDLQEALLNVAAERGKGANTAKIDRKLLGNWLKRQENTIAEGCKLTVDRSDKKRPRWRLVRVSE